MNVFKKKKYLIFVLVILLISFNFKPYIQFYKHN